MNKGITHYLPAIGFAIALLLSCNEVDRQKSIPARPAGDRQQRIYAQSVKDSFTLSVQLPPGYNPDSAQRYPVVYLLDANLYFDIMAATVRKYGEVGLLPPVILVGVGYKDFNAMDSLRNRDYTYPVAIPEYEMSISGGAGKFLQFLGTELAPYIDGHYATDTSARILAGHSLGGYFTMYALLQQLKGQQHTFRYYIAGSPSLHYNHQYLPAQLKSATAHATGAPAKLYLAYGEQEDGEENDDPDYITTHQQNATLSALWKTPAIVRYEGIVFSGLGHMDTPFPAFTKGIQWILQDKQLQP